MTQKKYDTSIVNVTNCLKWGLPNLCSCCGDIQIFSGLETERTADPTPCRRKSSASSGTTLSGTSARHFGTFAKRRSSSTSRWPVRMSSCLPTGSSWAPAHPSSRRCCAATRISTHSSTWKASHLEICRCVVLPVFGRCRVSVLFCQQPESWLLVSSFFLLFKST